MTDIEALRELFAELGREEMAAATTGGVDAATSARSRACAVLRATTKLLANPRADFVSELSNRDPGLVRRLDQLRAQAGPCAVDPWQGVPTLAQVERHQERHPAVDGEGRPAGGLWMVRGPAPQIDRVELVHLLAKRGRVHVLFIGVVVRDESYTVKGDSVVFFSSLEKCAWAPSMRWRPLTAAGDAATS